MELEERLKRWGPGGPRLGERQRRVWFSGTSLPLAMSHRALFDLLIKKRFVIDWAWEKRKEASLRKEGSTVEGLNAVGSCGALRMRGSMCC